jgi:hypothetical protein
MGSAGEPGVSLLLATGLMLLGVLVQFVAKMAILEDQGKKPSALAYLREHPYRALSLILCAWLALYVCREMGELTRVTAVLIGFGCESMAAGLHKKADARIGLAPP